MSLISSLGKYGKVFFTKYATASQKTVNQFAHITNPQEKELAQYCTNAADNLLNLAKEAGPEVAKSAELQFGHIQRYGFSRGDLIEFADTMQQGNLEILGDKGIMDALLTKRKGLLKEGGIGGIAGNRNAFLKVLNDSSISDDQLSHIMHLVSDENLPILKGFLKDKNFDYKILKELPITHLNKDNACILKQIAANGNVSTQEMLYIMSLTDKSNADIASKLLTRAGKDAEGISSLLHEVKKFPDMDKEALEAIKLRKKFLNELLDNPNFKLGAKGQKMEEYVMGNYLISKVLREVNPVNYDLAKKALLRGNVDFSEFSSFLTSVTPENKAVADKLVSLATQNTMLHPWMIQSPKSAERYLDEVAKIGDKTARENYLNAMFGLNDHNIDEVLRVLKSAKPEDALHSSRVISCLTRGADSVETIEPVIKMLEQSGRNLDVVDISIMADGNEAATKFLQSTLKNKNIPDTSIQGLTEKYIGVSEKLQDAAPNIPDELWQKYSNRQISKQEYEETLSKIVEDFEELQAKRLEELPKLLEHLTQNKSLSPDEVTKIFGQITPENFQIVEKYAQSSGIKKINLGIANAENISRLERLAKEGISVEEQGNLVHLLNKGEELAAKRIAVYKELAERFKNNSRGLDSVVSNVDNSTIKYVDDILARKDLNPGQINDILDLIKKGEDAGFIIKMLQNKSLKPEHFDKLFFHKAGCEFYRKNPELATRLLNSNMGLVMLDDNVGRFRSIPEVFGEKRIDGMLKSIEQINQKYGIKPKNLEISQHPGMSDDLLTIVKDRHSDISYKFDAETGKLLSVRNGNKTIQVDKEVVINDDIVKTRTAIEGSKVPYKIETSKTGKAGTVGTTYTESFVPGQYDIFRTKPDGTKVRVGHALYTPNGAKHIRRTLSSANGTRTTFAFREDKLGNSTLHSTIVDKSGNKLSEIRREFKVISDNHFISTKNGETYDIVFSDTKVVVTKLDAAGKKTRETVEYAIADIPTSKTDEIVEKIAPLKEDEIGKVAGIFKEYGIAPRTIDRSCVDMLKRLPGDEWFAMSKSCEFVMPFTKKPNNACYAGNSIFMSQELKDNLGVFCHELGHAKFDSLNLAQDKKLLEIYNAEKKAYTAKYPDSRVNSISYFLEGNENEWLRGLNEGCAETNLITTTVQSWEPIQDRTIFWEQEFPKTIAYLRERFAKL